MEEHREELLTALASLRRELALMDLLDGSSNGNNIEFLVIRLGTIAIRIDPNRNHQLPHFHIDLGRKHHAASVSIETGAVLAGNIGKYHNKVIDWASTNKTTLRKIWDALRAHQDPSEFLAELT